MKNQLRNFKHTPVLLQETIAHLDIKQDHWYIDCTLGGGGHSEAILKLGGKVLGIDQDQQALDATEKRLTEKYPNSVFKAVKGNFSQIEEITSDNKISPSGILFDLGISSHQINGNERGFSFQHDEKLDMRMDQTKQTITAHQIVNSYDERELTKIIMLYGEDHLANLIASSIVNTRQSCPINTTRELAEIIESIYRRKFSGRSKTNPATKTFQALRIVVNDELNVLKQALTKSLTILNPSGRIAVISFHSIEDRITKQFFRKWSVQEKGKALTKQPVIALKEEIRSNPRSRSAKLRAFEKKQ